MTLSISFNNHQALLDLQLFLERAKKLEDSMVQLVAEPDKLAVYVPVFFPKELLEHTPTVLGLRVFPAEITTSFKVVRDLNAVQLMVASAIAEQSSQLILESRADNLSRAPWAGIEPPRTAWTELGRLSAPELEQEARWGVTEVTEKLPESAAEELIRKARIAIWSEPSLAAARRLPKNQQLPIAANFAAFGLGFLYPLDPCLLYQNKNWLRLSTHRGHVLIKSPGVF